MFAALVLWLRYDALPHADRHRAAIVASIEKASGMSVAVASIHGHWQGLRPVLALEGLRIADRAGRAAFELEHAEASVSWWSLFAGRLHFHTVELFRPQLELRRGADGLIYLADKPLNAASGTEDTAFTDWLLSQPRLHIHDAGLVWRDDFLGSPELRMTHVEIGIEKRRGRYQAALTADPPADLAGPVDLRADLAVGRRDGRLQVDGTLYAASRNADLGRLREFLPLPDTLRAGVGSVRVWSTVRPDHVDEVVADVALRDARAQLDADALPLEVASLVARATYKAEANGFRFGTQGLRFTLKSGLAVEPGRFSLARTAGPDKRPRVELRADGIDLKIAAALVDYFPVPRDVKNQVTRFAPRGRIRDALVAWSEGEPRSYAVRGQFEDLSLNAVDTLPGLDGFDGLIEGNEAGGTLTLDTKQAALDLGRVFRDPLLFDTLQLRARWKPEGAGLAVAVDEAKFANADAEGELSGAWHSLPGSAHVFPGFLDIKGHLTRARMGSVPAYLPDRLAPLRDYLDRAVQAGECDRATFELQGDLYEFPFGPPSTGHFVIEGDVHGGQLKYHPDWPSVDAIDGTVRFENRTMEIRAKKAAIFASRVRDASAVIADFAVKPVLLTVQGEVDTTGGDAMRFLRESPLVNGPGAFTRAVTVEGPGRLKLKLDFPMGAGEQSRVAGEYAFDGATATIGRSLAMRDVKGRLAFSEREVRANDIAGTIFDRPATLSMATQGGEVVTSIAGRFTAPALAPWMPEPFLRRISGEAEYRARVSSGRGGIEVAVESPLKGLVSTLPEPLAKAADEARPLRLEISKPGTPDEVTRVALDGGVFGRVNHFYAGNAERWQAAFRFGSPVASEPRQDGLWLYGALPSLDVDAWQAVFAAPPGAPKPEAPAVATPSAADTGFALRGLDLRLARVHFLGRDFRDMMAALERREGKWVGHLESPLVAGEVSWDPAGRGSVVAKLARLSIPEATQPAPANPAPSEENELPAIDVAAERFDFRGRTLGALVLRAEPVGEEWRIHQLDITAKHSTMKSSGGWRKTGAGSITTLGMAVEVSNMNGLFSAFGYGDYLKRGNGHVEAELAWPGLPNEFSVGALSGTMKVEARNGQFAKIEPGAGKLLGLLSLQSLPRRATLDFRDVFSDGFAFEKIQGDVKIAKGILITDDFEISGPAAFVSLAGEVSLPQETQSLTMRVVPEVSESMALAATVFGTPVLGLSTLLISKLLRNPLGKVVAYEYLVTGSWDNPVITKQAAAKPS